MDDGASKIFVEDELRETPPNRVLTVIAIVIISMVGLMAVVMLLSYSYMAYTFRKMGYFEWSMLWLTMPLLAPALSVWIGISALRKRRYGRAIMAPVFGTMLYFLLLLFIQYFSRPSFL